MPAGGSVARGTLRLHTTHCLAFNLCIHLKTRQCVVCTLWAAGPEALTGQHGLAAVGWFLVMRAATHHHRIRGTVPLPPTQTGAGERLQLLLQENTHCTLLMFTGSDAQPDLPACCLATSTWPAPGGGGWLGSSRLARLPWY